MMLGDCQIVCELTAAIEKNKEEAINLKVQTSTSVNMKNIDKL